MPILGPTIGSHQWESFHLDRRFLSSLHWRNYNTLHSVRLLRIGQKNAYYIDTKLLYGMKLVPPKDLGSMSIFTLVSICTIHIGTIHPNTIHRQAYVCICFFKITLQAP